MRPGSLLFLSITVLLASQPLAAFQSQPAPASAGLRAEVKDFLDMYNRIDQKLYAVASDAEWKASTDVSEEHTGQRVGATQAKAVFEGSTYIIEKTKNYLKRRDQLDEMSVRQLETILYDAADYPGTIPDVVSARVAAEARQGAILDGFEFCYDRQGDKCAKVVTPNQLDDIL